MSRVDIVEVPPGGERDRYLDLLRLADDSEDEIRGYRDAGTLYALLDADTGEPIGEALAIPRDEPSTLAIPRDEPGTPASTPESAPESTVELKSVAIAEERQRQGLGAALIEGVLARLAARGVRRVIVGTSNASLGNLAFYQRVGFRLLGVERDYFSPAKGYGPDCVEAGIPVRDMVWMDRRL